MMFSENRVLSSQPGESLERLLLRMAQSLYQDGLVTANFAARILQREALFPTGIDMASHSIAIPHTESDEVCRTGFTITRNHGMVAFHRADQPELVIIPQIIVMMAIAAGSEKVDVIQSLFHFLADKSRVERLLCLAPGDVAERFTQAVQLTGSG